MAEYAANILKNEALYYRLSRATLRDGILHLSAGGSAETEITSLQLTNLTEHFRVSYIADRYCDSYKSDIRIYVYAKDKDGNNYSYSFFPCDTQGNMFLQEFQVKATAYDTFTYRIESDVAVNISLWELCPEAADINVQTIIDGVQQSLPRLLYDYNTWPLTVEDSEATVGLITFRLLDKTDLQGHFIMSFFASEAAILTMRFYTNEIEELFAPLTYDIRKGYNSIGIPHCYLHRAAGFYSVMATAQVSAGIITIPTRGVLYSIDGGYLAKRELDVAMDVQDLAIRQLAESYGPDEIWLVGIDAGEILVRKRDYNEINPNVAWTPVLSLGNGLAAAIEFDGYWHYREKSEQYTIETEEDPWYFWVDVDGILWGRHGVDETTLIQLDTNVSMVRACRGYKSEVFLAQDQGLVVLYLKESRAYYRQFRYEVTVGYKNWGPIETLLVNEDIQHISLTRLNDFRLAICLSNDVHNLWMYTDRTYVGSSAPKESIWISGATVDDYPYQLFAGYYALDEVPFPGVTGEVISWSEKSGGSMPLFEIKILLNYALFPSASFNEYSRLTINGRTNTINSIVWEVDEITGGSLITLVTSDSPVFRKLLFNIAPDVRLKYWANECLYYLDNTVSILWDDTAKAKEELSLTRPNVFGVTYRGIQYISQEASEDALVGSTIFNVSYAEITYILHEEQEELFLRAENVWQIGYYKTGEEPV